MIGVASRVGSSSRRGGRWLLTKNRSASATVSALFQSEIKRYNCTSTVPFSPRVLGYSIHQLTTVGPQNARKNAFPYLSPISVEHPVKICAMQQRFRTGSNSDEDNAAAISIGGREEKDSLGPIQVIPDDALYGAQTQRAIQNFPVSGRIAHPSLLKAYLRLKKAAARANAETGALGDASVADLIGRAVDNLLKKVEEEESSQKQGGSTPVFKKDYSWMRDTFPVDPYQAGAGTSQNMNINEVIANVANTFVDAPLGTYKPIHPNDHVNRSQSTNDTFPTAMRLALLESSLGLVKEMEECGNVLQDKAERWKREHVVKSARTHLQDAVPLSFGSEVEAYSLSFHRCASYVKQARNELHTLGIGGSAAGSGLSVPKGYTQKIIAELRKLTGEEKLASSKSLYEAMQSQAPVSFYSSMLRVSALEFTRICNDLRLMASGPSTGLNEVHLPPVQPGSSAMPGKVNPSIIEMANQAWFSVLGYDHTVAMCVQAGQLELNVMMPMMAYSSLEATEIMTNALSSLRKRCLQGLEPNREQMRQYFEATPQIAMALSPRLGYDATAKLVKESIETGQTIVQLVRQKNLIEEYELMDLVDPKKLT